jgi:hypothetical protein
LARCGGSRTISAISLPVSPLFIYLGQKKIIETTVIREKTVALLIIQKLLYILPSGQYSV